MSKTRAILGLKFTRDAPEAFDHKHSQILEIHCEARLERQQYEQLLSEIGKSKTSERLIVEPILEQMTELAKQVKETLDKLTKVKPTQIGDIRNVANEIEALLSEGTELTFSQLLEALKTTAPTLSNHLDRMVSENRLERTEIGRNVLYRLKR